MSKTHWDLLLLCDWIFEELGPTCMWIVMFSVVEWELLTDDQKDLHRRELDGLLGGGDGNCVADGGQIAHDALELGCRHLDRGLVLRVGDAQVQRFRLSTIPYPPSFP